MTDIAITSVVNTPSDQILTKALALTTYAPITEPIAVSNNATHLSSFVHSDIAHTNRTALNNVSGVNTGDQTSIKKTWSFSKTWLTGDSVFIKTKQVFLANTSFVRVYKDNVLLTYTTDWSFNTNQESKIGTVDDLVDGVEIISPVNASVYRVEFDEYLVPFSPVITLCRADGLIPSRNLPQNTIGGGDGANGIITGIDDESDDTQITYKVNYAVPSDPFFHRVRYADHAFCANFDFNAELPTGWRIEIYKIGRWWSGKRSSESGSINTTMDNTFTPRATSTLNYINLMGFAQRKKTGKLKFRIRNTTTNEVSLFSFQTIRTRIFHYIKRDFSGSLGRIVRICVD